MSGAARFSDSNIAPERAPPAASIASITRAPSSNSYTPGCRTHPATSTRTTTGDGLAEAAGAGTSRPESAVMATGRGSERTYQRPAPPIVTASRAIRPINSLRESADRRSRIDPSDTGLPSRGGHFGRLARPTRRNRDGLHIGREPRRQVGPFGLGMDRDLALARRQEWEPERERRAAVGGLAHLELAPVGTHQPARDVQAESRPGRA